MGKETEHGLFWLPNDPDERVDGSIRLDDDGSTVLTTYGMLGPFGFEGGEQQAIHGVLTSSRVKLVNCLATNYRRNVGRFTAADETTWHCQSAFRGGEYSGDVPNRVKSFESVIELLGDWTLRSNLIRFAKDGLSLSWSANQDDPAGAWDLGVVTIHQEVFHSHSQHPNESATVRAHTSIRIGFDEPQTWKTVVHTEMNLQALVSIAKGEAVHVERTSLIVEGAPDVRLGASYGRVLRRGSWQTTDSELFTMQELGGIGGVARWLDVLQDQEFLITALLVDRYRGWAFITDRTSHLLAACEAYQRHRMTDPSKRIHNLWTEVIDPMLCQAGHSFQEWIGDPGEWKGKVSDVRNNYGIGHLQGYGSSISAPPDFHLINEQLYLLVVLCLLSECAVSEAVKHEVVERMRSDWKIRL